MAEEVKIGEITHYFGKINVAAIKLTGGSLRVGDTIRIKGHTTDFTQRIDSMQIDRVDVEKAEAGQEIGIKVKETARVGDDVFKVEG